MARILGRGKTNELLRGDLSLSGLFDRSFEEKEGPWIDVLFVASDMYFRFKKQRIG